MVVELSGALEYLIAEHFKQEGLNDSEIEEVISRHDRWYGIIDGGHSNEAVKHLCVNLEEWKNFKWFVTILSGGHSLERYRQLSRAQNSRHSPRFYVELTFFDELNNLRIEYDNLIRLQSKPSHVQVARKYFGTENVSNTRKFLASMAIRLPQCTLNELGVIVNQDMPEECLKHDFFDSCGATSSDEIMATVDCRIFRKFVSLHSLRISTIFMNAAEPIEVRAQGNTLHRAKEYCLLNGLKTVQYSVINSQFKMALLALEEERKFLDYIGSDEWPPQMSTIRNNMLRSTLLDDEIEGNKGNEHTVLKSLRQSLLSISPNLVIQCDERLKKATEINADTEPQSSKTNPPDPPHQPDPPTTPIQHNVTPEELEKQKLEEDLHSLRSHGIDCVNIDWRSYLKNVWNADSRRAESIITEPPSITSRTFIGVDTNASVTQPEEELTKEEVYEMPILSKRLLKPGGYVILILKFEAFGEWFDSFRQAGYKVMPYPYVFGYKSDTIQDRNPVYIPQSGADYGLVAYLPSENQFYPVFKSVFAEIGSKNRRNLAIMADIPAPKSKLCRPGSRSPFITSEKSVKLLMEAIDLFTPKGGLSIDMFGGTMTTPMAALIKGRRCLCLERKEDLFKAAVKRLKSCLPNPNIINERAVLSWPDIQSLDQCQNVDEGDQCQSVDDVDQYQISDDTDQCQIADDGDLDVDYQAENIRPSERLSLSEEPGNVSEMLQGKDMDKTSHDTDCCEENIDDSSASNSCGVNDGRVSSNLSENDDYAALQKLATVAELQTNNIRRVGMKRVSNIVSQDLGIMSK